MRSPLAEMAVRLRGGESAAALRATSFEPRARGGERRARRARRAARPRRHRGSPALPARDLEQPRAHRHQHGNAERRGEDGDVRGRTARRRARCRASLPRIDVDELRGREVAREQDAARPESRRLGACVPSSASSTWRSRSSRSSTRSARRASPVAFRSSRARAQARAPREARALAGGDGAPRGVDEIGVVEQFEVRGHDLAHRRRRRGREPREARAHRVARAIERERFAASTPRPASSTGDVGAPADRTPFRSRGRGLAMTPRSCDGSSIGAAARRRARPPAHAAPPLRDCEWPRAIAAMPSAAAGSKPAMTTSSPPRMPSDISATVLRARAPRPRARISIS